MASPRALELAKRIWKWIPHSEGQRRWMLSNAKVKVAACGRRWGKSESTALDIVLYALENPNTIQIVVAPTADQTTVIMDEVERRFYSIPGFLKGVDFNHRRSPYNEIVFRDALAGAAHSQNLTLPTQIMSRTAGVTGRGLRGRKAHRVICDENAYISEKIMMNVITPLLADYDGQRVQVSTPNGLDHFYEDFERGQDPLQPDYESFQFPTSSNPHIPASYIERERQTKPEAAFMTEYLAEFRSSEGAVFRKVLDAIGAAKPQTHGQRGHQYLFGVDWGQSNDFTVIAVADVTTRELVHIDRFNQISYTVQRERLKALFEKFLPVSVIAESNSIGGPNIEALQAEGLPIHPFHTSNASKDHIVKCLILDLERGHLKMIDDPVLKAELMSYEAKKLPASGLMHYSAPAGKHDDCVIAACLVSWGMSEWANLAISGATSIPVAAGGAMFAAPGAYGSHF